MLLAILCDGAVKFRPPLGPVGARRPAGPLGGDLGATGARAGERSRGVDLAESRSLCTRLLGGERSLAGDRGLESRGVFCVRCIRSG